MIVTSLLFATLAPQNIFAQAKGLIETNQWYHEVNQTAWYQWADQDCMLFMTGYESRKSIHFFDSQLRRMEDLRVSFPFNESNGEVNRISISPDGTKLAWSSGGEQRPKWHICKFDSDKVTQFEAKRGPHKASAPMFDERSVLRWSRDGKSIYESMIDPSSGAPSFLWQRKLEALETEKQLPAASGYVDAPPQIIGANMAFGHRGLSAGRDKPSVGFVMWNPEDPSKTKTEWTVTVPNKQTIAGFEVSHDGTQILWDLGIHNEKHSGPFDWAGEEFWISDLKGKTWKSLGQIMFNEKEHDAQSQSLSRPSWVPGDKAISFIFRDMLYRLDVTK